MNHEKLILKIKSRFNEKVDNIEIQKKEWYKDANNGQTWKEHLLKISKVRKNENLISPEVKKEIENFIFSLENMNEESSLMHFSASSNNNFYGGWIINGEIVYCIPIEK